MQTQRSRKVISLWWCDEGKWKQKLFTYSTGKRPRVRLCLDILFLFYPKFRLQTHWGLSHSFMPAIRSGGPGRRRQSHHNELLWAVVWPYGLVASSASHPPPPPSTVHHTPLTPPWACGGAGGVSAGSWQVVSFQVSGVARRVCRATVSLAGNAAWNAWMVLALCNCGLWP